MKGFSISDCQIIQLNKVNDRSGNLTAVQNGIDIPFSVKRVYYLYDVPGGESRGAHAHKNLEQVIIAAGGSFDVTIDDGTEKKTISLNRPYIGFHLKPGIWRELDNFSSGATCLVLASEEYTAEDYIREYKDFISYKNI